MRQYLMEMLVYPKTKEEKAAMGIAQALVCARTNEIAHRRALHEAWRRGYWVQGIQILEEKQL